MLDIQEDFSQKYDRYGSMIFKIAMTFLDGVYYEFRYYSNPAK